MVLYCGAFYGIPEGGQLRVDVATLQVMRVPVHGLFFAFCHTDLVRPSSDWTGFLVIESCKYQ